MLKTNVIRGILNEIDAISELGAIKIDRKKYTVVIKDYDTVKEFFRKEASILKEYVPQNQLVRYHEICDNIESKLQYISDNNCNIDAWLEFLKMCLYSVQGMFNADDINDIVTDAISALQLSQKYYPVLGYSIV